MIRGGSVGNEV